MNKYIKTSYLYLVFCIPFFVLYLKDFFTYFVEGKEKFLFWSIFYLALLTQTSHPKSGHKACINAGWDTNQLIS